MILGLSALSFVSAKAQTGWYVNTAAVQVTPDDIGIGLPVGIVPNAKLKIANGFTQTGGYNPVYIVGGVQPTPLPCTVIGKPALSINWYPLDNYANSQVSIPLACSNEATLIRPNAFEIYGVKTTWNGSTQIKYALQVDHAGITGIGGIVNSGYKLNVVGGSMLNGNVQVTNKFRINSNANLSTNDWGNITTPFPYTFSVDNGNSRFLGKVEISAPITATNLTAKKPITAAFNNYMLAVEGNIVCQKTIVQTSDWADYVFAPNYQLMPLNELENYIEANNHLPAMPNTETVVAHGQDVGEIQKLQQAKIEELTLYIIQLKKELDAVKVLISK
jgi:hypothetical protein